MSNVRVVAAVVDTRQLTLYKEDGNTISIPQGDPRLRKILDDITPVISRGGIATVDISEANVYRDFEEQTGGFARFFRVARNKVAGFFGASADETNHDDPVAPTQVGSIPTLSTAIDDIIAHAQPADGSGMRANETVVAVVGSGAEAKVIPGMENLKDQFIHALKLGSTKGVENFLRRISTVIDQRQHSIHDLLRFMELGDLPIADDGSIIIYKILRRKDGLFVDCHSHNVTQRVGSYVCMDPKMVDPNRRNECSNGLHVARRGYLSGFPGDVCVLAKVAPEDVIAVPNYDANKMRVCGYHIIFELDDQSFSKLKNNRPMTDTPKAQALLGRAISGDHIGRIEEVRITQQRGGGLIITPLDGKGRPKRARGPVRKVAALDDVASVPSVDPRAVAKTVTETKAQKSDPHPISKGLGPKARLFELEKVYRNTKADPAARSAAAQEMVSVRRRAKKSWNALGYPKLTDQLLLDDAARFAVPKTYPDTQAGRARRLFDQKKFGPLYSFKKSAKKGWAALGFSDAEISTILANKPGD